jgi:hypothetical protein
VEVEVHEEALVEVVVFCKPRPATLEVLLAVAIIPNLHLKKENNLGEAEGAAGGGALRLGAAPITLGLFLLPGGRPG